ncbi:MAG: hypothetical protein B6D39_12370 [Anaerolineae bacterium UTCFX2]|nr:MAG: hypothetical protein B6D39_12370 [Anaerolineae bacterium UTCFX2]
MWFKYKSGHHGPLSIMVPTPKISCLYFQISLICLADGNKIQMNLIAQFGGEYVIRSMLKKMKDRMLTIMLSIEFY